MMTSLLSTFLTLLLLADLPYAVVAALVKTVVADQSSCSESFVLDGNVHTYRIIMPDQPACSVSNASNYFNCKIHFSFSRHDLFMKRCVDFSRLRMAGESTRFSISYGLNYNHTISAQRLRLMMHSVTSSTVRCYDKFPDQLVLTFHSDCNDNLRNYFGSWVYVYYQPDKYSPIYHLDGTCRHTIDIKSNDLLTIRSYIWHDTANETDHQVCTLWVKTFSFSFYDMVLCPTWLFWKTSCQLSAHQKKVKLGTDRIGKRNLIHAENATCHSSALVDTCMPFDFMDNVLFAVQRNTKISVTRPITDGALFFETQVQVQVAATDDTYESTSSPQVPAWDNIDFDTVVRVLSLVAVFVVLSICFCNHVGKKIVNAMAPLRENNAAADASSERVAMQPLMDGSSSAVPSPGLGSAGQCLSLAPCHLAAQDGSMNVPPPPYSEVISSDYAARPCSIPISPVAPPSYAELYGHHSTTPSRVNVTSEMTAAASPPAHS